MSFSKKLRVFGHESKMGLMCAQAALSSPESKQHG